MTKHEKHFEHFQPHTKLKHAILSSYLAAWAPKLLFWGGAGNTLVIVDAFAGQGRDDEGNDGSPVIAARRAFEAMATAEAKSPALRPQIHVIAIERNATNYSMLVDAMQPFKLERPDLIELHHGELADAIDNIARTANGAPTFYFLDPFGIKGLDAGTYSKALAGRHNEIFALFADLGATRLHGLVTARYADPSGEIDAILSTPSLFPEEDTAGIAEAEAAAATVNDALDASKPAAREHLTRALGNAEWVAEIAQAPREDRPDAFIRLFRDSLLAAGAQHVVSVPIRNDEGHRVYSLVHASKSKAGFVTMKDAVTTAVRNVRISDEARRRIVEDLSVDVAALRVALARALAGRQLHWADQSGVPGVKTLVLQHSALFQLQVPELKSSLKDHGILVRVDKKEMCVFPPLATP